MMYVLFIHRKSHTGVRLTLNVMTLNDLEQRNGRYFALFSLVAWGGQLRHSG